MRFIVDLNLLPRTVSFLNDLGHDAITAKDVMPARSPDTDIVAKAIDDGRVIVTMDSDIPRLIAASGRTEPSAILIRISNPPVEAVNRALAANLPEVYEDLLIGAIVTIDSVRYRTRRLPVQATGM